MRSRGRRSQRRFGPTALLALLLALLVPAAAAAEPRVRTAPAGLATGKQVRVLVAGAPGGFRALVGSTDVTRRFRDLGGGRRAATLRRGGELRLGENRIVIRTGSKGAYHYAVAVVALGKRVSGRLRVRRDRGRAAVRLRVRGPARDRFERLRVVVNGKRVGGRAWVVGHRTRAGNWPRGRAGLRIGLGRREGLRPGRNRIVLTAWNAGGAYDRAVTTVNLPRRGLRADAGPSRRVAVGRGTRLDGRGTASPGPAATRYSWRVVAAPQGARPRLSGAQSARPRLLADTPGTYRVKLLARSGSRVAADETTVEATPPTPPLGVPVQTMAGGGIAVGGETYAAEPGGWAQIVALRRNTLELVANRTIGSGPEVSAAEAQQLGFALAALPRETIAIVSGGGRQVTFAPGATSWLASSLSELGADLQSPLNWYDAWTQNVERGSWSAIGVPQTSAMAQQNMFGLSFGAEPGKGGPAGALAGYLQESGKENLYNFTQANYVPLDTNAPGTPAGVNKIEVGDAAYTSEALSEGDGGFHVLILDANLGKVAERTFRTNTPFEQIESETVAMQEMLSDLTAPGLGQPGLLVIVQSINQPAGSGPNWLDDEPLVRDAYGDHQNAAIARDNSTWFAPHGSGQTLAGALGEIGGAVAHDHVAQMSRAAQTPTPAGQPGGYTLVASSGSTLAGTAVDPSAEPVSRLQATGNGASRVVGNLIRDHQSLWAVGEASWGESLIEDSVARVAYQPPVPWPLTETPQQEAAIAHVAEQLKVSYRDFRTTYWADDGQDFSTLRTEVGEVTYPEGASFSPATLEAVKTQLRAEIKDVANVYALVDKWEKVFATTETSGEVDLQSVAKSVLESIDRLDSGAKTSASSAAVLSDSLWVAAELFAAADQEEIAGPVGAFASAISLASDLFSAPGTEGSKAGVVEAEAEKLGQTLAKQFETIQSDIGRTGEILVSDWGKLRTASSRVKNVWKFNDEIRGDIVSALERGAQREFTAALLSTAYDVYVVNPRYVSHSFDSIAQIECIKKSESPSDEEWIRPFADQPQNATSWISRPVGFEPIEGALPDLVQRSAGLVLPAVLGHPAGIVKEPMLSAPGAITGPLFEPALSGEEGRLGEDPIAFFADPRFDQLWFYCSPVY